MRLAVVVPVLNEERTVEQTLARLAPLRANGVVVIVVDGGSTDRTVVCARNGADHVLFTPRGRALQMNAGARRALADRAIDTLLFLHADSRLPDDAEGALQTACAGATSAWGRFDVRIDGASPVLGLVATMMNLRSRITGICTGDQCLFATRALFEALGGFAEIPLMEDIEFSRRARRVSWPIAIRSRATTSGRRWEQHGVVRTILLMWRLRLAYFLGADPARLSATYRDAR